jgi:hypothetical protein
MTSFLVSFKPSPNSIPPGVEDNELYDIVSSLVFGVGWVLVTGGCGVGLLSLELASSTPTFQASNLETNAILFVKSCKTFVSAINLIIFLSMMFNYWFRDSLIKQFCFLGFQVNEGGRHQLELINLGSNSFM